VGERWITNIVPTIDVAPPLTHANIAPKRNYIFRHMLWKYIRLLLFFRRGFADKKRAREIGQKTKQWVAYDTKQHETSNNNDFKIAWRFRATKAFGSSLQKLSARWKQRGKKAEEKCLKCNKLCVRDGGRQMETKINSNGRDGGEDFGEGL
jgi:hypothetical protein